jgi:hypothetical protein
VYIETVPNRSSAPAILLREGFREDGRVRKRTLANLSHWEPQLIEHFRLLLKGGVAVESAAAVLSIERALPHGHVAAVLGAARGSGCAAWFGSAHQGCSRCCDHAGGACSSRRPSWPRTARCTTTRPRPRWAALGVGQCSVDDLYRRWTGCTRHSRHRAALGASAGGQHLGAL